MLNKTYKSLQSIWKIFYNERLKFLDEIEEKLSLKLQQVNAKYEYSFPKQIKYTQLRILVRSLIGGICVSSLSLFYTDVINDPNRPFDVSIELLQITNNMDERTYFAFDDMIRQGQEMKSLDVSTYCAMGNLLASINQSELSQTAYYFAHLKNHKEIKANSDLQFETEEDNDLLLLMDKLDKIIAQLDELEISQKHREDQIKHNQTTFLLKLPKVILIQRVCGFLDDNDLYKLTATCSTMRKVMFCPLGFKLLMLSRNVNHLVGGPKPQQLQYQKEKIDLMTYGNMSTSNSIFDAEEDAIAQLQVLKAVKDFLTSKLQESQSTIHNLEDMLDDVQATLKYEKSVNLKLQSKINILQNQLSISELQRQDVKENLSELNSKYNKIIIQMEADRGVLQDEKEKLLGHKKVLIEEVYRLRNMVASMEENQNNYREALKQVKCFMENVELKPI